MQTFLPYPDFKLSAECLDKKRAWKQVVEAHQLIEQLELSRKGLPVNSRIFNHPACRQWWGYVEVLKQYYNIFLEHCITVHGIKSVKLQKKEVSFEDQWLFVKKPEWLGNPLVHSTHRGRLLFKDPEFYGKYNWVERPRDDKDGYYWPVDKQGNLEYAVVNWKKLFLYQREYLLRGI